jgi:hypothetical protein
MTYRGFHAELQGWPEYNHGRYRITDRNGEVYDWIAVEFRNHHEFELIVRRAIDGLIVAPWQLRQAQKGHA